MCKSIFVEIASGALNSYRVYEDAKILEIMDIFPINSEMEESLLKNTLVLSIN